jgi:hypothetical protein
MNTLNAAVEAFSGAIESAHGEIKNRIVKPRGAYCRAVLPLREEVQHRDVLQHGAALRMHATMLEVVPFVFREVCSNGAIWAHSGAAFSLPIDESSTEVKIARFVAESAGTATSADTFQSCLAEVRTGMTKRADLGLLMMSIFRSPRAGVEEFALDMVLSAMRQLPPESTRYDAMNIVTAAAREVPDPEVKWHMESLATTLLLDIEVGRKAPPTARQREHEREFEFAGA